MATRERPSKLRWLAVLMAVLVLGCDPAAETDAGGPDAGFDAGRLVDAGFDAGPPEAELTITPALQDFGDFGIDEVSSSATFTVTNSGGRMSDTISAAIGGGDAGQFRLGADTCTGAMLAAAEACTVAVTFEPTFAGGHSATLTATDGLTRATATLNGAGYDCGSFSITPAPHDFGSTTVGTTTAPTMFTVRAGCSGTGLLTIVIGGLDASQFTLGVDNCTGMALALGMSCTVEGIYSPTTVGAHAATIEATASPGGTVSAAVTGDAPGGDIPLLLPGVHDFGFVASGSSSATVDFTLRNSGSSPTGTISHTFGGADASEFSVTASTCAGAPLAGGATCTITVRFNAGPPGAKTATIDVTDGSLTALATLTATSMCGLHITPSSYAFGARPVGSFTLGGPFTVTNSCGTSTGTLLSMLGGASPADFPFPGGGGDTCTGTMLPSGGFCIVGGQFNPTATGLRSATLTVSDGSLSTPPASLSGTGI